MKRRNFYTLALWVPVAWPVIIGLGEVFLHDYTWHQMSKISGLIILGGLCGGVQYLFFAAFICFWLASKAMEFIDRVSWYLPVVFALVCSLGLWCFFTLVSMHANNSQVRTSDLDPLNTLDIACNVALYVLGIGYGYFLAMQLCNYLLTRFELLED